MVWSAMVLNLAGDLDEKGGHARPLTLLKTLPLTLNLHFDMIPIRYVHVSYFPCR